MATQPIDRQKFKQKANKKAYKTPRIVNRSNKTIRPELVSPYIAENNRSTYFYPPCY